ncbi:MAG: FAD:protein FMN transferase [Gemmatimonadetes bacterium]|nr:FAD:protein FMN transferase [Gemmatimonadota bacterium]
MRYSLTASSRRFWAVIALMAVIPAVVPASQARALDRGQDDPKSVGAAIESPRVDAEPRRADASRARVERIAWLMGTRTTITVEAADHPTAVAASEAALAAMARVERRLSTWRDDSELARLNRVAPGTVVRPSADVAALLAEIAEWADITQGAFHPAVGALVDAWDLRDEGRFPAEGAIQTALLATGPHGVHIDPASGAIVRRDAGAWLDAGAFGKGAALRQARQALRRVGASAARIDLGGQILLLGRPWSRITVAHPTHRSQPVADLHLRDVSVATSGQSERGIEVDGERFGHLLDPRIGRPAPAWGSVTVVHPDPVAADVLATALFVLGPEAGLRLATSLDVAAFFLVADGDDLSPLSSPDMCTYLPARPSWQHTKETCTPLFP